jgi:type 1 fimbria pilin
MNNLILTRAIPLCLCMLVSPKGYAESVDNNALKGRVYIDGSIVDSGCVIRVGNDNQTVAMQAVAMHGLLQGDATLQTPLNIYISNCIAAPLKGTESLQAFRLTFDGESEGRHFIVQGAAKGVALQIRDAEGRLITPGMLLQSNALPAGNLTLNYFLRLVGSGQSLQSGNYHSTIKLNIQHF